MRDIVYTVSLVIGIVGSLIIVWGVVKSAMEFFYLEFKSLTGTNICADRDHLRHHLGSYILLGLEFLIAADIIKTIIHPSLNEMAILGSIVAVRTVLSYFLNKEMENRHACSNEKGEM